MKFIQNKQKRETYTKLLQGKMNSKQNQVFNLFLTGYIFSEKGCKVKNKEKKKCMGKSWLKNRLEKSEFSNIFAEMMVNDKEEFGRYWRINTAPYQVYKNVYWIYWEENNLFLQLLKYIFFWIFVHGIDNKRIN